MGVIRDRLNAVFALDPSANCVGTPDGVWYSYGVVRQAMERLDAALTEAGIGAEAAVAVLLRNRPANYAAVLALVSTGRCIVTVNPQLPPQALIEDVTDLSAAAVVADEEDWEKDGFREAVAAKGMLAISIAGKARAISVGPIAGSAASLAAREARMPGTALEMLTSGTTGKPKRIKLSYDSLSRSLASASAYEERSGSELKLKSAVGIQVMPLAHIGGFNGAIYQTYNARSFVLMERFDVDQWHAMIVKHRPKFTNLPPSAFYMVLDRNFPKEDLSSLLALRCGSAPLDHERAVEFEQRYGVPILEAYGATEFAGGVAGWTISDHRAFAAAKRKSVGRAVAGVELRVVDRSSFEPLATNEEGLLEVRSKQLGNGNQWVRTSDLARVDEDGFLFLLGRADSAIIRGGFKVMPDKVEEALKSEGGVAEACVVGIPDARLGQVPVAVIVPATGAVIDLEFIRQNLRARLKAYEVPTEIRIIDSLPRTPSMKVSQAQVRELFQPAKLAAD